MKPVQDDTQASRSLPAIGQKLRALDHALGEMIYGATVYEVAPSIETWKRSLLRERDLTELTDLDT